MVFDTAIMRCEICDEQRPEPMLTLSRVDWEKDGKRIVVEIRYCIDKPNCINQAGKKLKEAPK